jgi:hypothetical protein
MSTGTTARMRFEGTLLQVDLDLEERDELGWGWGG